MNPASKPTDAVTIAIDKTIDQLGYAGLLPFIGLAGLLWCIHADLLAFVAAALTSYAAVIAAFLGGVHWGVGFLSLPAGSSSPPTVLSPAAVRFHFVWGITPSLIAWLALLMPSYAALPLLSLVLVLCYAVDRKTYAALGLSHWLPLRLRLTVVATLSCLLGAAAI